MFSKAGLRAIVNATEASYEVDQYQVHVHGSSAQDVHALYAALHVHAFDGSILISQASVYQLGVHTFNTAAEDQAAKLITIAQSVTGVIVGEFGAPQFVNHTQLGVATSIGVDVSTHLNSIAIQHAQ